MEASPNMIALMRSGQFPPTMRETPPPREAPKSTASSPITFSRNEMVSEM